MRVMKFGGTSMGSVESISAVAEIIKKTRDEKVVVVSAMSGVTNQLIEIMQAAEKGQQQKISKLVAGILARHEETATELIADAKELTAANKYFSETLKKLEKFSWACATISEISNQSRDLILSVGERLSARLLAGVLAGNGTPAAQVDLKRVIPKNFKKADSEFYLAAEKNFAEAYKKVLKKKAIPVGTGYFGDVPGGMLESIGRGYSDFSAALAAAGLRADRLEIWTDVSGILSADPRKVKKAQILEQISFEAAAELAHFGAKVIHPQCIHPAVRAKIPVWIKNTFAPKDRGTEILAKPKKTKQILSSLTAKKEITVVNIVSLRMLTQHDFLAEVFATFAENETPIDLVSTSEVSVSVAIDNPKNLKQIEKALTGISKISVTKNRAIVCAVGLGMHGKIGVSAEIFSALAKAGINIEQISQGASEINISCIIAERDVDTAIATLHAKFFGK